MPPESPLHSNPDSGLTLVTLGAFALRNADGTVALGPGKPLALLSYLALSPGRTASREHLIHLLWGGSTDPDRARHALRQALWQLRTLLGETAIDGKDDVTLAITLASDRNQFLAAIEAGEISTAVNLYGGPFIMAFASPGGAGFEHWADAEREYLRTAFAAAAELLCRRHLAAGRNREALALARRLIDPGGEPLLGRRIALEAHLAAADSISALADADALERWAAEEGVNIDATTRDLLGRARRQVLARDPDRDVDDAARPPLVAELVGREREFAAILVAWVRARHGEQAHVHLVAPAGLGKSRLLLDLEGRLAAEGQRVRYVRAHPGDRGLPAALISGIAEALATLPGARAIDPEVAATLVALNPTLAGHFSVRADNAQGAEGTRRRVIALTELFKATADESPIALLVDDLHWADTDSIAILESVIPRIAMCRILLVTATRPSSEHQLRSEHRLTLPLSPLAISQVEQLLDSIAAFAEPGTGAWVAERIHGATDGSPLLILELLQSLGEQELLRAVGGRWLHASRAVLEPHLTAGEGLRRRLGRLGTSSREALQLLALAGAPMRVDILAAALDTEPESVLQRLQMLERHGLAIRNGQHWEVSHDEIADAAVEMTPNAGAQHRALGESLLRHHDGSPQSLGRAAKHFSAVAAHDRLATLVELRLRAARTQGERLTLPNALDQVLGLGASQESRRAVRSRLPLTIRHNVRPLAVVMLLVAGFAGLLGWRQQAAHSRITSFIVEGTGPRGLETYRVEIDPARLNAEGDGIEVDELRTSEGRPPASMQFTEWSTSTAGDSVYFSAMSEAPDPSQEIFLQTPQGLRRLTDDPRDDLAPVPSPDGRHVWFVTARWSPSGDDNFDLATIDTRTGEITPRTTGPDTDSWVWPSPDGSRIAFTRRAQGNLTPTVCVAAADGTNSRCHIAREGTFLRTSGWLDLHHVLAIADHQGQRVAVSVDVRSGLATLLRQNVVGSIAIDPTMRYVACACMNGDDTETTLTILAADGAGVPIRVPLPPHLQLNRVIPAKTRVPPRYLDTLAIINPGPATVGLPHRLRLRGRDQLGDLVAFDTASVRWHVANPEVATIDSLLGELRPTAAGQVLVIASLPGWRSDTQRVTIGNTPSRLAIDEHWIELAPRWRSYGTPQPAVTRDSLLGTAFLPQGDGSFPSGTYMVEALAADSGVVLEAMISTPVQRDKWQQLTIEITSAGGTPLLAAWDHRSGPPPLAANRSNPQCTFGFPAGEGRGADTLATLATATGGDYFRAPDRLRTGVPVKLRLALLPDGTCAVALDDTVRLRTRTRMRLNEPMRVWIQGHSVGTRIAVGPLRLWQGDPGGVVW